MMQKIDFLELPCAFVGSKLSDGPLPAFFYFSLSAEESLTLHPYNSPVQYFTGHPMRIFSFTIPGHEEGRSKFDAMKFWAEEWSNARDFLEDFLQKLKGDVNRLIQENLINTSKMVCGGLSRGAFIATHMAACVKGISHVLGFAPVTKLSVLEDFADVDSSVDAKDLRTVIPNLLNLNALRFYMGNDDTRVGTDPCYQFIREFALYLQEQRVRTIDVEMMITKSIGHKGHGTAPHIFEEGSKWLLNKLFPDESR